MNERPALKDFFCIDGAKSLAEPSYGEIFFKAKTIAKNETSPDSAAMEDVILELCEEIKPHYIFVALGNDKLNKATAFACQNALKALDIKCHINFAQEDNSLKTPSRGIKPVFVCENFRKSSLYNEIERMAFNAHLVWEKNLNVN